MKCEIVTGNMPQLWEDLLSQLHEKEYPSESIRHYREAMGRVLSIQKMKSKSF